MAWVFERTVEVAAWVALIIAWSALGMAIYWTYLWIGTLQTDPQCEMLYDITKAAGVFVGFSLALGGLACIDRFLFDIDE